MQQILAYISSLLLLFGNKETKRIELLISGRGESKRFLSGYSLRQGGKARFILSYFPFLSVHSYLPALLAVCLSVCPSFCISLHLSVLLSVCICLSPHLSGFLFACLSINACSFVPSHLDHKVSRSPHHHHSQVTGCVGRQSRRCPSSCSCGCCTWRPSRGTWCRGRGAPSGTCPRSPCSVFRTEEGQTHPVPC